MKEECYMRRWLKWEFSKGEWGTFENEDMEKFGRTKRVLQGECCVNCAEG